MNERTNFPCPSGSPNSLPWLFFSEELYCTNCRLSYHPPCSFLFPERWPLWRRRNQTKTLLSTPGLCYRKDSTVLPRKRFLCLLDLGGGPQSRHSFPCPDRPRLLLDETTRKSQGGKGFQRTIGMRMRKAKQRRRNFSVQAWGALNKLESLWWEKQTPVLHHSMNRLTVKCLYNDGQHLSCPQQML